MKKRKKYSNIKMDEITIDVIKKDLDTNFYRGRTNLYHEDFKGVTLTLEQINSNLFIITKKESLVPTELEMSLGIIHIDDECSLIYNEFGKNDQDTSKSHTHALMDEQEYLGIVTGVKWNNVNIYLKHTCFEIINGKKCVYNRYNSEIRPKFCEYGYIEAQNIESVKEALSHVWMVEYDPLDL
jgi:hypothetical protein